jgi:hypothetical protein
MVRGMGRQRVFFCVVVCVASAFAAGCSDDQGDCAEGTECDVTLQPPEVGFQVSVGPVEVPRGTEVLRCFWRTVPMDADITEIRVKYNLGSHHLDVFSVPYKMPDGDFDCSDPTQWGVWPSEVALGLPADAPMPSMLVGFQNEDINWILPNDVGFPVQAGQQLMIQSHFANVSDQATPLRMLNLINFTASKAPVVHRAETLFDEDMELVIPANSKATFTRICEFPEPVNLIGMFGHFHSRGTQHQVFAYDTETGVQGDLLYTNTNWSDPPWTTSDKWGGPMMTRAIRMVSSYDNTENREIVWGPFVGENEHFETYAMFYPQLGLDPLCVCHREGELAPGVKAGTCN